MAVVGKADFTVSEEQTIDEHSDMYRTNSWKSSNCTDPHVQFFKTRMCPFREQGCRRGESCTYAHNELELRPSLNLTKTKLCYAHIRGKCQNSADQCRYAHGHNNLRSTPNVYKAQTKPERINRDIDFHTSTFDMLMGSDTCKLNANDSRNLEKNTDIINTIGRINDVADLRHNSQQWSLQTCCGSMNDVGFTNALSSSTTRSMPGIVQSHSLSGGMSQETLRAISSSHSNDKEGLTPYVNEHSNWNFQMDDYYNHTLSPYDTNTDGLGALLRFLDSRRISVWEALYILKSIENTVTLETKHISAEPGHLK